MARNRTVETSQDRLRIALANARTWRAEVHQAPNWTYVDRRVSVEQVSPTELAAFWTKRAADAAAQIKAAA